MTPVTSKRGSSVGSVPIPAKPGKTDDRVVSPTTKQTITVGRTAFSRIRSICMTKGMSFQEFAIRGLNKELRECGEPTIEELEAGA